LLFFEQKTEKSLPSCTAQYNKQYYCGNYLSWLTGDIKKEYLKEGQNKIPS